MNERWIPSVRGPLAYPDHALGHEALEPGSVPHPSKTELAKIAHPLLRDGGKWMILIISYSTF